MKRISIAIAILLLLLLVGCKQTTDIQDDISTDLNPQDTVQNEPQQTEDIKPEEPIQEEPTPEETIYDKAQEILSQMSLEEKVGQMFIARCPENNGSTMVGEFYPGGYILFDRDFKNKTSQEVIDNIQSYQDAAKIPMLIAIDEEGGTVVRASRYTEFYPQPFESPQDLYKEGGFEKISEDTAEKCDFLAELGINVNMAPVCDVSQSPSDYIYKRTFGKDSEQTAEYVKTVVKIMQEKNMGSVLKHFPGYGNNADTHTGIAYDKRDYNNFQSSDFVPFKAGIDAGAKCILVSHNIVECMDADMPASLSEKVHKILRDDLKFEGVIMTDDLAMDAIKQFTNGEQAAVLAVEAGNDLICCTDFQTQIPAVLNAVNEGTISEEQIDQSVIRIIQWKINLGIIQTD